MSISIPVLELVDHTMKSHSPPKTTSTPPSNPENRRFASAMTGIRRPGTLNVCDDLLRAWFSTMVAVTSETSSPAELERFVHEAGVALRRALVARYGLDVGRDAAADALAWAVEHWVELAVMSNPVGYLYRVGQTSAKRQHRWHRPDVVVPQPVNDDVVDVDLQRALMTLRAEERIAVLMVHGFGYRYRDVAEVLDTAVSNVTNHVNRGLARLRTLMEHP